MAEVSLRRRRALGLIVGIPLVLALSLWALTFTPLFRAHHIRVQGATALSPVEVRSLAGVDGSTNVVHLDDVGVVGRLEESPWIADASVHVELPDTLVLEITERRPVGVIDALGESGILASDATLLPMTAGAPSAEPENFLRAFVDADGDTLYETPIFNFAGTGNTAYIDPTLGTLSAAFATFSNIPLPPSTAPDGRLRLRFEMFNDTNSPSGPASEAEGLDNIVVTGLIPEPTTSLLLLSGLVASAHRRRRRR